MKKVKIQYIGQHQPREEIEVDKEVAAHLLTRDDYSSTLEEATKVLTPRVMPDTSWTEKKIKKWLKLYSVPINYSITNDNKVDKLKEIEKYYETR